MNIVIKNNYYEVDIIYSNLIYLKIIVVTSQTLH